MQIFREESMQEKSLREIPRTDEIQWILVEREIHPFRLADQADADRNRLIEIEAIDGVAVFLRGQQQATNT